MAPDSLKILKYPWHIGHDYELTKLPHAFSFLSDTNRSWASSNRPIPPQVRFVPSHRAAEHDLMILHVDQWILEEPEKLYLFTDWRDRFPGYKVIINHGCNLVDGCTSEAMAGLVGDLPVVCNSQTAHDLWKLPNSRFIRHGMSPEEWPETDYAQHNIVVVQSYHGERHQAYRNKAGVEQVEAAGLEIDWVGRDRKFTRFNDYRNFLGRSSIFFNPSHASPNPRTRTEAMLCGLAIVTTNSHGESEYIENGVNGYCSNDLDELAGYLKELETDPALARRIGQAGRETARKIFHIDRFIGAWEALIAEVTGGMAKS